jgi:hypothetical protein
MADELERLTGLRWKHVVGLLVLIAAQVLVLRAVYFNGVDAGSDVTRCLIAEIMHDRPGLETECDNAVALQDRWDFRFFMWLGRTDSVKDIPNDK